MHHEGSEGARRWFLSSGAAAELCWRRALASPRPVFEVRNLYALEDMTVFELLERLTSDGCSWALWKPPSAQNKTDRIPIG